MNNKSKAPNFLGLVGENKEIALSDFAGKYLVIYFYPKDKTSGCTVESQDFRDLKSDFQKLNCEIVGVSSCLLYTSPSPRDGLLSRMPSSA